MFFVLHIILKTVKYFLFLSVHIFMYVLSPLLRFLAFSARSAEGSWQRENTAILQYEIGMCILPYAHTCLHIPAN